MSMSSHVIGFKPPDEKWQKMKAIWDACLAAEVDVPEEVEDFFDGEPPDSAGVEVKLEDTPCCKDWGADGCSGFEIDITKLPKDVTVIRAFNSW